MSNKALIAFLIGILLIVIIIICLVANSLKDDGTRYSKVTPGQVTTEQKEKQNKTYSDKITNAEKINSKYKSTSFNNYYLDLSEEQRYKIDDLCDKVANWVKTRDVDKFYPEHMDAFYKNALFSEKEFLLNYLDEIFPSNSEITVSAFEMAPSSVFIYLKVKPTNSSSYDFVVEVSNWEEEDFIVYFGKILDTNRLINSIITNEAYIEFSYLLKYSDHSSLVINVQNRQNKELNLDFAGTKVYERSGKVDMYHKVLGNTKHTIPANQKAVFELNFEKYKVSPLEIDVRAKINSRDYTEDMIIVYQTEEIESD